MPSFFSFNTAINFNQNDPGSRRSRRQRLDVWTIVCCVCYALGCGGRVCGLYVVGCVAGAPMCITVTFFFTCGDILGQSDVLIGLSVFLLGLKKKLFHFKFRLGS